MLKVSELENVIRKICKETRLRSEKLEIKERTIFVLPKENYCGGCKHYAPAGAKNYCVGEEWLNSG